MAQPPHDASLTVRDNTDEGRFEAVDESGVVAGFAAYRRREGRVVFTHTEVDDAFEGRGVGSTLVRAALDAVRDEGVQVVPLCPFVRSYIHRHPEYADLVA
jgi:predicted GNAT family acetyltransferase